MRPPEAVRCGPRAPVGLGAGWARAALERELRRWRALGHAPLIWWRDDDAREPTPALDRLLELADGLPIALAVIPDGKVADLARRLERAPNVTVSQHGVDHLDVRTPQTGPCEYPVGTGPEVMAARIRQGRLALQRAGLAPAFYTPPWNAVDEALPQALAAAGYLRLSANESARPTPGLLRVDCHLDILRWKGGPRFRGAVRVLRALTGQLRHRRTSGAFTAPIGLLTHHLVHDGPAWSFLEWFVPFARRRMDWRGFAALAAAGSS